MPTLTFPLDLSGVAATNLISAELHNFPNAASRIFVPEAGPFYTQGLVVRNAANNAILQPGNDYKALHLYEDAVMASGKEVCACIYVTASTVAGVRITYQCVGGAFTSTVSIIENLLQAFTLPGLNQVSWGQIIDAPVQYPPTEHIHHVSDLYGMNDVVSVLEGVRIAILAGDVAVHQAIYQYIANAIANDAATAQDVTDLYAALASAIATHKTDNNAHTKDKVGLSNVANFPISSQAQAEGGAHDSSYMTPQRTFQQIVAKVNKAFVGLGNVADYPIATITDAQDVNNNVTYMTPARTAQMIAALGGGGSSSLIEATEAEGYAGANDAHYTTPLTARRAAQGVFGTLIGQTTLNPNTEVSPIFYASSTAQAANLPLPSVTTGSLDYLIYNLFQKTAATDLQVAATPRVQIAFGLTTNTGGMWRRSFNGTTWTAWATVLRIPTASEAFQGTSTTTYLTPATGAQVASGVLRHVGSIFTTDPNTTLAPVFWTKNTNCPTGFAGQTAGDNFMIMNTFNPTNATDVTSNTTPRMQVAIGNNVDGVWHRYYNGITWSPWAGTGGSSTALGTADVNTVVRSGVYIQDNAANATLIRNYPVASKAGRLVVTDISGDGTVVRQEYTVIGSTPGGSYAREVFGTTWSNWQSTAAIEAGVIATFQRIVGEVAIDFTTLKATYPNAYVLFKLRSGGGSGGVAANHLVYDDHASGGAGGGYVDVACKLSDLSNVHPFTIGPGGASVAASGAVMNGIAGGSTSITIAGVTITVSGGEGGTAQVSTPTPKAVGGALRFGTRQSIESFSRPGQAGGAGGSAAVGGSENGYDSIDGGGGGGSVYANGGIQQLGGQSVSGGAGGNSLHVLNGNAHAANGMYPSGGGGAAATQGSGTATSGAGGNGNLVAIVLNYMPQATVNIGI